MHEKWKKISPVDRHCFGCGTENPQGLQMTFETNGEKVRSFVTIPRHVRGWSNIVHGGVIATICDEIMAWAAIHLLKKFVLTKTIHTSFLRPITIDSKLKSYGYIQERIDAKTVIMAGEIYNDKGKPCAKSTGEFALFKPEAFKKLNIVSNNQVDRMTTMFEQ